MSDEQDTSVLEDERDIEEDEEVLEDAEQEERGAKESDVAAQELVGDAPVSSALDDDAAYDRVEKSQLDEPKTTEELESEGTDTQDEDVNKDIKEDES